MGIKMYFKRFPFIEYNFGNNEANTIFPNISAYVDIADQLNISEKTVSTYKLRLMKKLKVSNLVELIDHGRQKK